jgi:flagellar biosynthesis protein FlhG
MREPVIISIGGGKGGVGKSITTANIAASLANRGFRVGLLDADLRGANLHLLVGVKRPKLGLQDFIAGRAASLIDVAGPTAIPNAWLISGASDIVNLANPLFAQKQKIISHLRAMDADYILVDLGAGTDNQVSDFFAAFTHGIVVIDSLSTSVENAYGFLKNGIIRGLIRLFPGNRTMRDAIMAHADPGKSGSAATIPDMLAAMEKKHHAAVQEMRSWLRGRKSFLVLNMVRGTDDIGVVGRFHDLVDRYLGINILYIGYVVYTPDIRTSVRLSQPLVLGEPANPASRCFEVISQNLVALTRQ